MLIFLKYNNFNYINIKNYNKINYTSNQKNNIICFFFDFRFKFIRSFINIISYFFLKYSFSYLRFNLKNNFRLNFENNLVIFLNDFSNFFYF